MWIIPTAGSFNPIKIRCGVSIRSGAGKLSTGIGDGSADFAEWFTSPSQGKTLYANTLSKMVNAVRSVTTKGSMYCMNQESTFQEDSLDEGILLDKYDSHYVPNSDNSTFLDYESFGSQYRSLTSSFSRVEPRQKDTYNQVGDGKTLNSKLTCETDSHNSDSQGNPAIVALGSRTQSQEYHEAFSNNKAIILWLDSNSDGSKQTRDDGSSVSNEMKARLTDSRGRSRGKKSNDSSTSSKKSTGMQSIDSSNQTCNKSLISRRSKSLETKSVFGAARSIFRVRNKGASKVAEEDPLVERSLNMPSVKPRAAVKNKLPSIVKQEGDETRKRISRKKGAPTSFWSGMTRGRQVVKTPKRRTHQRRSKSMGAQPTSRRPQPHQRKNPENRTNAHNNVKSHEKTSSKSGTKKNQRSAHSSPTKRPIEDSADRSILDSFYDAFATWNAAQSKESMAAYENIRLGDADVSAGKLSSTRRRLEIAPEKMGNDELQQLSQVSPAFDRQQGNNDIDGEDTETKAEMTIVDSVAEEWEEIIDAAAVIARHYEVDWLDESDSIRKKENKDFREALKTFKEHAKRLNMDHQELFAAVREDQSDLNDYSTFDEDSTFHYLGNLWAGLVPGVDAGLDRYVDAFDGMMDRFRCGTSRRNGSKINSLDTPPRCSKTEGQTIPPFHPGQPLPPSYLEL